jgi:hypothetical protein
MANFAFVDGFWLMIFIDGLEAGFHLHMVSNRIFFLRFGGWRGGRGRVIIFCGRPRDVGGAGFF